MASPVGRTAGLTRAWSRPSAAVLERDVLTGVSMAFVGGFVDAAGFMALAGLFTSHVTGNFVLIGDQLAAGTGGVVAKLAALPIFVLAVGGARLVALATERRKIATMRPLLLLEASLLSAFLLAGMVLSPLRFPDSIEAIFVGMFAVAAMGVQNAIGRLAIDLIALRRGDFLAGSPSDAAAVVDAFEKNELRMIHLLTWAEAGQKAAEEKQTAATIEADIIAGARRGHGIIRVAGPSDTACLMLSDADLRPHIIALADPGKDASQFMKSTDAKLLGNDVEQAFIRIQRQQCVVVYGGQGDLKLLIQGMKRQNISYAVAPVWVSPADLEAARARAQESDVLADQALAARKQAFEAERTLQAAKHNEAEQVRARKQADLRRRYGQEAATAFNQFSAMVRDFFAPNAKPGQFGSLFPNTGRTNAALLANKWQVDPPTVDLLDYGTAEWKGRRAEAIFAMVKIRYKNNLLGQYKEQCYALGYLIDSEFLMLRDAVEANCDEAAPALESWKNGRSYESRWVVSAN